jgi:hypothetical protein
MLPHTRTRAVCSLHALHAAEKAESPRAMYSTAGFQSVGAPRRRRTTIGAGHCPQDQRQPRPSADVDQERARWARSFSSSATSPTPVQDSAAPRATPKPKKPAGVTSIVGLLSPTRATVAISSARRAAIELEVPDSMLRTTTRNASSFDLGCPPCRVNEHMFVQPRAPPSWLSRTSS